MLERRPDCVARLVDVALLARWLRQEGATIEAIPDARLAVDQHWVDAVLLQQTHPLVRRLIHRVVARSDYLLPECWSSRPTSRADEDQRVDDLELVTAQGRGECGTDRRVWDPARNTWARDDYGDVFHGAPRDAPPPFRIRLWYAARVAGYDAGDRRRPMQPTSAPSEGAAQPSERPRLTPRDAPAPGKDPVVIRKILTHLGIPTDVAPPGHRRLICSAEAESRPPVSHFPTLTLGVRPSTRVWRSPTPGRPPTGSRAPRGPLSAPGPPIMRCVVTEGRRAGRRAGQMAGRGEG